jgi:membrane protease YdiL (CAAX protease family)
MCSLAYLAIMGWQPLVAVLWVRRRVEGSLAIDAGLRGASPRFLMLGLALPVIAMSVASAMAVSLGEQAFVGTASTGGGIWQAGCAVVAVLLASSVIYGQCVSEELAWRGYFLVRVMECIGPWRGLTLHGLIWGAWYAPLLVWTSGGTPSSWTKAGEFTITCVLLGILLGWLRLASRSIVPALLANVALTLGAGLPIVLGGGSVGARGAIYSPVGWLPLIAIAAWLAISHHRNAVQTPRAPRARLPRLSTQLH